MTYTAYLLLELDITKNPPRVVGVRTASESADTITVASHKTAYATLTSVRGASYDEALKKLLVAVGQPNGWFSWVVPLLERV